jgi:integrase/recombinase XerD
MTTPLRAKYIRDLAIRGRAERTHQSYSRYVSELARYYHRSPELISYQEVADWLYYLVKDPWNFSRGALPTNRCLVRRAEKSEFAW